MTREDDAVVGVINFLLILGLLTAFMITITITWDPAVLARAEREHMASGQSQFTEFASSLDDLALSGRPNAAARQTVQLGSEARGFLTSSKTAGLVQLETSEGSGSTGLTLRGSFVQPVTSQPTEGPLDNTPPPTICDSCMVYRGDRGDPTSLTRLDLRLTDVSRLASNNPEGNFRVMILRADVCADENCPTLDLNPTGNCNNNEYQNKVIWAADFAPVVATAQDVINIEVWPGSCAWRHNDENGVNGETLNLLCVKDATSPTCPIDRPPSLLDTQPANLRLWDTLFPNGAGVPGQSYDIWFVNGNKAWGTYNIENIPPSGSGGSNPGTTSLPLSNADQPLSLRFTAPHAPPSILRIEHGAILRIDGTSGALVSPPPFAFRYLGPAEICGNGRDDDGDTVIDEPDCSDEPPDTEVTLRLNVLSGVIGSAASSGPVTLSATLIDQREMRGTAGYVRLTFPTESCSAWTSWFNISMADAGLLAPDYTSSCDSVAGIVTLEVDGRQAPTAQQDIRVNILWSRFLVEVVS